MRLKPSRANLLFRVLVLVYLGALFVWLPLEDTDEWTAITFAGFLCVLATAGINLRMPERIRKAWWILPLQGALSGLALTPLAILLMAMKTGLHNHSVPDYTTQHLYNVVNDTPLWVIAGLLIGSGIAIYNKVR